MKYIHFKDIDLNNPFFDSLKADYVEFGDWFKRKANEKAYVKFDSSGSSILGFLYLKEENEVITDVEPNLPAKRRIKVGTFKVEARGTKYGQRFIKKLLDHAVHKDVEEVYVTVFKKHNILIGLLEKYGFKLIATKTTENGTENVYIKDMRVHNGQTLMSYPLISRSQNSNKFLLSIRPDFHSQLFPDSLLNNESYDLIKDVSSTNSIHKVYVCRMRGVLNIKPNDLILIYRTKDRDPARYRSVVTSICVAEEIKTKGSFKDADDFIRYTKEYSIFDEDFLRNFYKQYGDVFVIKMTYNIALNKRITRDNLINNIGLDGSEYWGVMPISDKHFDSILEEGEVYENLIVD